MRHCPVCDFEYETGSCPGCGYDASCDYEACPTLTPIPTGLESVSARNAALTGAFRCPDCGGTLFFVQIADHAIQCARCKRFEPLAQTEEDCKKASSAASEELVTTESFRATEMPPQYPDGDFLDIDISADWNPTPEYTSGSGSISRFLSTLFLPFKSASNPMPRQSVAISAYYFTILLKNGHVFTNEICSRNDMASWQNVVAISAGRDTFYGICKNGTVLSAGFNGFGQRNTETWTDIVSVSASDDHVAGLRRDGTVVAVGDNRFRQCNTQNWTDITAIASGRLGTVGLKQDGTVVATGTYAYDSYGLKWWRNIIAIGCGDEYAAGLRKDGTVSAACDLSEDFSKETDTWVDIVSISAGRHHLVGLHKDWTVSAAFEFEPNEDYPHDVSTWTNIIAVSAGERYTVGLRADGTVVATGQNHFSQCNVSEWKNIAAIYAGRSYTIGVRRNGTLVCTDPDLQKKLNGLTVRVD